MKFSYLGSPKITAIIIGILVAFITIILESVIININIEHAWKVIILTSFVSFILVYVIVYYLFKRLIINQIKPIYKTIKNIEFKKEKFSDKIDDLDIISIVNRDVKSWARNKTQEITQLKQMEKYRKEFIGNVSHELKTPIFNIQGFVSTLLDGGLEDDTINRKYLERTEKSIDRMISIVEDLSAISKLESGELDIEMIEFNIIELFKEVIEQIENKANNRNISIIINTKESEINVFADRRLISQVLINLLVNSINYGKDNGKIRISFIEKQNLIDIKIHDNGIGINEADRIRLFERFYRVDKSRSKEKGGTGLGLAIVKHILEAHNQIIFVKSIYGEYSEFTFSLKRK